MLHSFSGAFDFAGAQGTTIGGAAGPSEASGGNTSFGGFSSGGASAGFNPFVSQQSASPLNLVIVGAVILGGVWLLKKK